MGIVSKSWVRADIRAFSIPFRIPGTGNPIMGPMATYMRGISMATEVIRRVFMPFWFSSVSSRRFSHSLLIVLSLFSFCIGQEAP